MRKVEIIPKVTEDWYKDYEKAILTKKYSEASTSLANFFTTPSIENLKTAYSYVTDYVTNIPLGEGELEEKRDEWIKILDEINLIINGNPQNEEVSKLYVARDINLVPIRVGLKIIYVPDNIVVLGRELRKILNEAGTVAMGAGLRMLLPRHKKYGIKRLMEEEGIEDLEIGEKGANSETDSEATN